MLITTPQTEALQTTCPSNCKSTGISSSCLGGDKVEWIWLGRGRLLACPSKKCAKSHATNLPWHSYNAENIDLNYGFARSSGSKSIVVVDTSTCRTWLFCPFNFTSQCPVHLQVTQVWQSPQSPSVETHLGWSAWSRQKCTAPDPKIPKGSWRSSSIHLNT